MEGVAAAHGRAVERRGPLRGLAGVVVAIVLVAAWFLLFRPQGMGGSVAYVGVRGNSMAPTMHDGDLVVVRARSTYAQGDVIAYQVPSGQPGGGIRIIHRIIGGDARAGFITKGDADRGVDAARPKPAQIIGKVWFRLPGTARFFNKLPGPGWLAILVGVTSFLVLAMPFRRKAFRSQREP